LNDGVISYDSTSDVPQTSADIWSEFLTSIENSTPPIGEPKATATPAALAAAKISRILPPKSLSIAGKRRKHFKQQTHSDYEKIG
jgi:hypothetical protein